MIPSAEHLTKKLPTSLQSLLHKIYRLLVGNGCEPDVKTLYISFTKDASLVASAHIGGKQIELALALSEDHPSGLLEDASHLTWRTLPVCICLDANSSHKDALNLVREALDRVMSGEHDIDRPSDFFAVRPRKSNWNQ